MHHHFTGHRRHNRLIGNANAALVQGGHKLVRHIHIVLTGLFAFARWRINDIAVTVHLLGDRQRFFRIGERLLDRLRMRWQRDATCRNGHGNRPARRLDRLIAHRGQKPLGDTRQSLLVAMRQHQTKFITGIAPHRIVAPRQPAQTLTNTDNHFVSDIEAVGLVHERQIIDRQQNESPRTAVAGRRRNGFIQRVFDPRPRQQTCQIIIGGKPHQTLIAVTPLVDQT